MQEGVDRDLRGSRSRRRCCLQFSNFEAQTNPERVGAHIADAVAFQARAAETLLLNVMSANSTQVAATSPVGTARDFLARVGLAAAYRNRQRMQPDALLDMYAPAWIVAALHADAVRSLIDDPWAVRMTQATVVTKLAEMGVRAAFYVDSAAGKGQLFGTQAPGALNPFPRTAVLYVHALGSFVHLDAGELDLGIVRDSALTMGEVGPVLKPGNRFRVFAETFETAAYLGREALEVTLGVDTSGSYAAARVLTALQAQ